MLRPLFILRHDNHIVLLPFLLNIFILLLKLRVVLCMRLSQLIGTAAPWRRTVLIQRLGETFQSLHARASSAVRALELRRLVTLI